MKASIFDRHPRRRPASERHDDLLKLINTNPNHSTGDPHTEHPQEPRRTGRRSIRAHEGRLMPLLHDICRCADDTCFEREQCGPRTPVAATLRPHDRPRDEPCPSRILADRSPEAA